MYCKRVRYSLLAYFAYFTYPDGFRYAEWVLICPLLRRSPSLPFNEGGSRKDISIDEAEELVKNFRFYIFNHKEVSWIFFALIPLLFWTAGNRIKFQIFILQIRANYFLSNFYWISFHFLFLVQQRTRLVSGIEIDVD